MHASLLRSLYAFKHKMFGVKPQEVHTVILKIKSFTLSSTANAVDDKDHWLNVNKAK